MATIAATGVGPTDGTADADVINGDGANNSIRGGGGNDTIFGNVGDDLIDGQSGNDLLIGGVGNDGYFVDSGSDQIIENGAEGTDTVTASVSYALGDGVDVENLTAAAGTAAINLTGNAIATAQTITGNAGANFLDGGVDTVADTLVGLGGNDTYLVRSGDVVTEGANGGADSVFVLNTPTFTLYQLAAGQEVEVLSASTQSGTDALNLVGSSTVQTIVGNFGVNILDGFGGGADTLIGLQGNDTYQVDAAAVVVVEAAGEGSDTVRLGVTGGLGTDFAATTGNYVFTGDIEVITAAAAANAAVADINITGGTVSQRIEGSTLNNVIIGGGGRDTLVGGAGNDIYTVDSADDVVDEVANAGAGVDRVNVVLTPAASGVSGYYVGVLATVGSVESLIAAGYTIANATGVVSGATNGGDGTLNFNSLNTTNSTVPIDRATFLVGNQAATQVIFGDAGANILNGYANGGTEGAALVGFDSLAGGNGDDQYRVYQQGGTAALSDVVIEDTNGGGDIIYTSASFNLETNDAYAAGLTFTQAANGIALTVGSYIAGPQQIEVLSASTQSSTTALTLTGNQFGNIIIGTFGADTISGSSTAGAGTTSGGVDVLFGLLGNDIYNVDSVQTFVNENAGEGTDVANVRVSGFTLNAGSSIETLNLTVTGSIVGNELGQTINGSAGADTLNGGGGADTLVGGVGADVYQVDSQTDVVSEVAGVGNGFDTIFASVSYDLRSTASAGGVAVEQLVAANGSSTVGLTLIGNESQNTIVGTNGDDILNGDNDTLTAGVMTGTVAGDRLVGLGGNDTYRVYGVNDTVLEAVGGGANDVVFASGTYRLNVGQEIETLSAANQASTTGVTLRGNEFGNVIIGTDGVDVIDGRLGNDLLIGRGAADTFEFTTALNSSTNVDTIVGFAAGDRIGLSSAIFTVPGGITAASFTSGTPANANQVIVYDQVNGNIFYDADGNGVGAAVLFAKVDPGLALGFNDFVVVGDPGADTPVPTVSTLGL